MTSVAVLPNTAAHGTVEQPDATVLTTEVSRVTCNTFSSLLIIPTLYPKNTKILTSTHIQTFTPGSSDLARTRRFSRVRQVDPRSGTF